jgi:hypothetical protein
MTAPATLKLVESTSETPAPTKRAGPAPIPAPSKINPGNRSTKYVISEVALRYSQQAPVTNNKIPGTATFRYPNRSAIRPENIDDVNAANAKALTPKPALEVEYSAISTRYSTIVSSAEKKPRLKINTAMAAILKEETFNSSLGTIGAG